MNVCSLPFDCLNNISFSLAYFTVRIWYVMPITYKISVHQPLMLLVRFPINSRLSVVKFGAGQKSRVDFSLHQRSASETLHCSRAKCIWHCWHSSFTDIFALSSGRPSLPLLLSSSHSSGDPLPSSFLKCSSQLCCKPSTFLPDQFPGPPVDATSVSGWPHCFPHAPMWQWQVGPLTRSEWGMRHTISAVEQCPVGAAAR